MNKELVLKHLSRFRHLLQEDKETCIQMKDKSDSELIRVGTNQADLDKKIESHTNEIKELEEVILSVQLL